MTRTVVAEVAVDGGGGGFVVTGGRLTGLQLVVPPGALTRSVTVRAVVEDVSLPPGVVTSTVFEPGERVRLEPADLDFAVPARLTLPYAPLRLNTAPGNVRVLTDDDNRMEPEVIDVDAGRVTVPVHRLGSFQVVEGPRPPLTDYLPASGARVPLEGGWTFTALDQSLPHAPLQIAKNWTITDDAMGAAGFYTRGFDLLGRFSVVDDWDELWLESRSMFGPIPGDAPPGATETLLYQPRTAAAPTGVGTAFLDGQWSWAPPVQIGSRRILDALELRLQLQWTRDDGNGGREVSVLLAPDLGLLALRIDGVERARTDL